MRFFLTLVGCVAWLGGCVGHVRGQPLYPMDDGQPAPPDMVAELSGLVQSVDGRDVPTGPLELLPGCHVVTNSTRWGASDSQGSVTATLRPRSFSINMRASYSYVIRVERGIMSGSSGSIALVAEELDPKGNVTRRFQSGQPCQDP
jgi:hypothetical protein